MNSYNHYAYGAVCQWLFEGVAGFRPDPELPGFRRIVFEPTDPARARLRSRASHDSAAGRIEAGWTVDGDAVTYDVIVPEGARALLVLGPAYRRRRRRRRAARPPRRRRPSARGPLGARRATRSTFRIAGA